MRRDESIPSTWGVDATGHASTDPAAVYHKGGLLPLGGAEATGGYKGYGLNLMVEMFCGVLANAAIGPAVRQWGATDRSANLGQFFGAIDPTAFGEGFSDRLQDLLDLLRQLTPSDIGRPVRVAGDPERAHCRLVDSLGGIPYHRNQIVSAAKVAERLGVKPLRTLADE